MELMTGTALPSSSSTHGQLELEVIINKNAEPEKSLNGSTSLELYSSESFGCR